MLEAKIQRITPERNEDVHELCGAPLKQCVMGGGITRYLWRDDTDEMAIKLKDWADAQGIWYRIRRW